MQGRDLHASSVEIGKLISGVEGLHREMAEMRKGMSDMASEIKTLTEFKTQGKTILLGVSLAAGGMGAAFKVFWDYMKGHFG